MSTTIGVELPAHPFFLATLFVPQSRSLPERPHPIGTTECEVVEVSGIVPRG
jgi:CTP synthase (UTP-ammonia lyase)